MRNNSKIIIFLFLILIGVTYSFARNADQKIDLGALSVEGEIITPEDLIIDSDNQEGAIKIFKRTNYKDRVNLNIQNIF